MTSRYGAAKFVSDPLHTIASETSDGIESSLVKSYVNSSCTGMNIKILPQLTKFRTRSLSITTSRSHKLSIIGSRKVLVSLAVVCRCLGSALAITVWVWQDSHISIMRQRFLFAEYDTPWCLLSNLKFRYMKASQEKREPYAVHFVSAKSMRFIKCKYYNLYMVKISRTRTVLPAKSDSDVMFLQSYQGLIINRSFVY